MQIRMHAIKQHGNIIPTPALRLRMQRLMDITKEMHHEAQTLAAVEPGYVCVRHARRVVRDRADYAAALVHDAVTRHVDAARLGRRVPCVDVVPPCRVGELWHVPHFVREEGCFRDVLPVEQRVGEYVRLRAEVHARQVRDCAVAQAAPCCGLGDEECQWDGDE